MYYIYWPKVVIFSQNSKETPKNFFFGLWTDVGQAG